jgi:hemolysin activation/secretion protein
MRITLLLLSVFFGAVSLFSEEQFIVQAEQGCKTVEMQNLKTMRVRSIRIEGNMALTGEEMHEMISPYLNRELTPKDMQSLCFALQQQYVDKGYPSTCVFVKQQNVNSGVLVIEVTEARSWP